MWIAPLAIAGLALLAYSSNQSSSESYGFDPPSSPPSFIRNQENRELWMKRRDPWMEWVKKLPISRSAEEWLKAELEIPFTGREWAASGGPNAEQLHRLLAKAAIEGDPALKIYLDQLRKAQSLHRKAFPGSGLSRKGAADQLGLRFGRPPLGKAKEWIANLPVSPEVKAWASAEIKLDTIKKNWSDLGGDPLSGMLHSGASRGDAGLLNYLNVLSRVEELYNRAFPDSGMSRKGTIDQLMLQFGNPW